MKQNNLNSPPDSEQNDQIDCKNKLHGQEIEETSDQDQKKAENHSHFIEKCLIATALILASGLIFYNAIAAPALTAPAVYYTPAESVNDFAQTDSFNENESDLIQAEAFAEDANEDYADTAESDTAKTGESVSAPVNSNLIKNSSSKQSNASGNKTSSTSAQSKTASTAPSVININTAGKDQLTTLPGIGEVKAQAIVDYRSANGPFLSVNDLTNVKGIGEATLEKLRKYVSVG